MEHLGPELQERRLVGVISLEFHLQPESPSFPHSVQGPLYYGFPLVQVVVMRLGIYPLALAFPQLLVVLKQSAVRVRRHNNNTFIRTIMAGSPVLLKQSTLACGPSSLTQSLFASHSNRLLAVVSERTTVTICSLNHPSELWQFQSANVEEVIFSSDDSYVIINCVQAVRNYSLTLKAWAEDLFPFSPQNEITSIVRSIDHTKLLSLNHSRFQTFNFYTRLDQSFALPNICQGEILELPRTDSFLTCGYDCTVCSFRLTGGEIVLVGNSTIRSCRSGGMALFGNKLVISLGTMMEEEASLLGIDIDTLKIVDKLVLNSTLFPLKATNLRNYLLIYSLQGSSVWTSKNTLNNAILSAKIDAETILDSVCSPLAQTCHFLVSQNTSTQSLVASYSLGFNCSGPDPKPSDTIASHCSCKEGEAFQRSSGQCILNKCGSGGCACPQGYSYDGFSLECSLNCSQVQGSAGLPAYGLPQQCFCRPPRAWSSKLGDCSGIDCSYISRSAGKEDNQSCKCQQGFVWSPTMFQCVGVEVQPEAATEASSISVGALLGIIFAVAILIVLLITFCYRRRRLQTENQKQPYVPYDVRKVLEQLPTHRNLEDEHKPDSKGKSEVD